MGKRNTLIIFGLIVILSSCGKKPENNTGTEPSVDTGNTLQSREDQPGNSEQPTKLSPIFESQLIKALERGSEVTAAVKAGAADKALEASLKFSGVVELADAGWPDGFLPSARTDLLEASEAWTFGSAFMVEKNDPIWGPGSKALGTRYYEMSDSFKEAVTVAELAGGSFVQWEELPDVLIYAQQKFDSARKSILEGVK